MLSINKLAPVLDKLLKKLRIELGEARIREIREGKSEFQVYIEVENSVYGVIVLKLLIKKDCSEIRVYTGRVSLDLRIKRFLKRELKCSLGGGGNEATP